MENQDQDISQKLTLNASEKCFLGQSPKLEFYPDAPTADLSLWSPSFKTQNHTWRLNNTPAKITTRTDCIQGEDVGEKKKKENQSDFKEVQKEPEG